MFWIFTVVSAIWIADYFDGFHNAGWEKMSIIVAITTDRREQSPKVHSTRVRPSRPEVFLKEQLVERIVAAGGSPILLPPLPQGANVEAYCQWVCRNSAAVVISGGAFDIDPRHYGEAAQGRIDRIDEERTGLELALAEHCVRHKKPLLGICGGMQALAVALGGGLIQDIATENPDALEHEQPTDPAIPWHPVSFASSRFQDWYQSKQIMVNSTHHQAVRPCDAYRIAGQAPDGVIEAIELGDDTFCVGVQWHPELLSDILFRELLRWADK